MGNISLNIKKNFLKQPMMSNTFFALLPLLLTGVYFYGLKVIILFLLTLIAGFLTEFAFAKLLKQKISMALFVSVLLYVLTLPPNIPIWISIVGIIFGISFGKMLFGGFGKNIFNPAITARAFIYISFGPYLTSGWINPMTSFPAGLIKYKVDSISSVTPLKESILNFQLANLNFEVIFKYLFGNKSGCIGEGFILLILVIGLFLIYKKYASWQVVISGFISFIIFSIVFYLSGKSPNPLYMMTTGGWFFGLFFMITDPVTCATTKAGKFIYGSLYSLFTILIRIFGIWTEGAMFAILLSNVFGPTIDYIFKKK